MALGAVTLVLRVLGLISNARLRGSAQLAPLVDRDALAWADRFILGLIAGWVVLLLAGALLRHRRRESPLYVGTTLSFFWATNATFGLSLGYLGGAFWVAQLAAAIVMLLLFGPRRTYLGMIPGVAAIAAAIGAERLHLLAYAPVLRAPPYAEGGHPPGDWVAIQVSASVILTAASIGLAHILVQRMRQHEARLEALGTTDALTGLKNRRGFRDAAVAELSRAQRSGTPVSVLMLDIDHFKRVNDVHGHAAGDAVLARVGATLRGEMRDHDVIGRYGGEEFVVLLPGVEEEAARQIAERLRARVSAGETEAGGGTVRVTATLGVASWGPRRGRRADLDALVARADDALYRGKEGGRDRVVVEPPEAPPLEA
jgi:diguanylate cyclase (GGDEF)-like protein